MKNLAPQLSREQFNAICDAHNIPAADRKGIAALVYYGKPVGKALHTKIDGRWRRSRKNGVYAKAMEALLAAMSPPGWADQFPPKDYQVPEGYDFHIPV